MPRELADSSLDAFFDIDADDSTVKDGGAALLSLKC